MIDDQEPHPPDIQIDTTAHYKPKPKSKMHCKQLTLSFSVLLSLGNINNILGYKVYINP